MTYRNEIELLRAAEELRQALSRQANDLLTAPQISNAAVSQAGDLLAEIQDLDAEIHEYRISLWRQLGRPNITEGTQ